MYKTIVVPIDLSDDLSSRLTLPVALNFVKSFGATLHLINIIPDVGISMLEEYLPKQWMKNQKAHHTTQLDELVARYVPADVKVEKFIGRGHVYDEIINYANSVNADLFIVPSIRPELQDYMLGTTVSKIVRHSKISVLVVRD